MKYPELWEVYLEDRWLPEILKRLLSQDSHGVDVGCHIGSFLSLLNRYAPKGAHIAFEPSMAKFNLVRRRFPSASIHCCAVADSDRIGEFEEDVARSGYSRLKGSALPSNTTITFKVKICKLDTALREVSRIDLIKLDIEGAELAALRGAELTIRKFLPTLIFECGSEYWLNEHGLDRLRAL